MNEKEMACGMADGPMGEPNFLPRYPQTTPFYLSHSGVAVLRSSDHQEVARCTSTEAAKAALSLLNG